jgi:hypothetical protein
VKRGEVEPPDDRPDRSRCVIFGELRIDVDAPPRQLLAACFTQAPRSPSGVVVSR